MSDDESTSRDPFRARVNTEGLSPQAAEGVVQRTPDNDPSVAPSSPPEHPGDRDPSGAGSGETPRDGGTSQDVDTETSGQGPGDNDAAPSSQRTSSPEPKRSKGRRK